MAAATKFRFQSSKSGTRGDRDSSSSSSIPKRGKPTTASSYKYYINSGTNKVAKMSSGGGKPRVDKRLCYQCSTTEMLTMSRLRGHLTVTT